MDMKRFKLLLPILLGIILTGCGKDRKKLIFPIDGFAVAGQASYQKRTPTATPFGGIKLVTEEERIRGAVVHVVDSVTGELVAEGATDKKGQFIVGLPDSAQGRSLAVRILSVSAIDKFPMMVVNQKASSKAYHFQSQPFVGTKNDFDLFITNEVAPGLAGAFNVYTQIMRGYEFMVDEGGEANTKFPELLVKWESDDVGIDCTCFFKDFLEPSIISLRQDENDDSVIIHEFGHYLQNSFSKTSSPGGLHIISCSQNQDPRLMWSEGWATGFSLMVRRSEYYIDTANQTFFVRHEDPCHIGQGSTSETIIAAMYMDLYDGGLDFPSTDGDTLIIPFQKIWAAMKNVRNGFGLTVYDFYVALTDAGVITPQQWIDNFETLGLTVTNMTNAGNNASSFVGSLSGENIPPSADTEFQATLEQF